ncbi:MAG: hypothetical protein SGJ19_02145, partial [Planctomycetia bacterium]|nr:hypothetical protein [Planctomycetia bacterium]
MALPRWVVWRREARVEGDKPTKMPYQINGVRAKANDASTWTTFDAAAAAYESVGWEGMGFQFGSLGDGFVGGDLDDCFGDEYLKPWAVEIIAKCATYAEISPSGNGVKFIAYGSLSADQIAAMSGKKTGKRFCVDAKGNVVRADDPTKDGAIEIYQHGRFFTVTGNRFDGAPLTLADCTQPVRELFDRLVQSRKRLDVSSKPPAVSSTSIAHVSGYARLDRCKKYLAAIHAVSGHGGDSDTYQACCETQRFGLSPTEAWEAMVWFNDNRCSPPWDHYDLDRKLNDAIEEVAGNGTFGSHLTKDRTTPSIP